ncbi:hypothetical protein J2X31_000998 [Flavobacterium arsenatis]|uniref:Exostosin GT47 domain-containing protein n=1 Tax=Flavobacterium arsenatis TaxID=1484332 RepID=A0ABU1TNI9_9FLAO|nr:exostosin family protein [Flavobacterium arsenatis]MDR6966998.1 hypothetical protein [Flavobacterium arsenatis]
MNIYIPPIDFSTLNKKSLFVLTRPFLNPDGWGNSAAVKQQFEVSDVFAYVDRIEKATVFFIPNPINSYSKDELNAINSICMQNSIKAYGYISGDLGADFGYFDHIVFFRMGGFKSQLPSSNKSLPVSLSDHFERIYKKTAIDVRERQNRAVVGFCGHATLSSSKSVKENIKFVKENLKRFFQNPFRKDYEPLFASALERAKLLKSFEASHLVETNFIYRNNYRAGATSEEERAKTTLEYYDNIKTSDYVLCVRGAGNFSVRLYETLMMGRIPIFVNTDCLLPFGDKIQWKNHVVWVEWKNRKNIANLVAEFHSKLSDYDFKTMQLENRKLWKEQLSVASILNMIMIKDGI